MFLLAGVAFLLALPGAGRAVGEPLLIATVSTAQHAQTISMADSSGHPISEIGPGTYDIEVRDNSEFHNFRLTGPGVSLSTTVPFVGTTTWEDVVVQPSSSYAYRCDPHAHSMSGSFTTSGVSPPPPPPAPQPQRPLPVVQTVSGFRVSLVGTGGRRRLVARATVTIVARAQLRLKRGARTVATAGKQFRPGRNELRLALRPSLPRGVYVARLTVAGAPRPYTARIAFG